MHQLQSVPGYVVLYKHSIGCWGRAEGGDGIAAQSLSGEKQTAKLNKSYKVRLRFIILVFFIKDFHTALLGIQEWTSDVPVPGGLCLYQNVACGEQTHTLPGSMAQTHCSMQTWPNLCLTCSKTHPARSDPASTLRVHK